MTPISLTSCLSSTISQCLLEILTLKSCGCFHVSVPQTEVLNYTPDYASSQVLNLCETSRRQSFEITISARGLPIPFLHGAFDGHELLIAMWLALLPFLVLACVACILLRSLSEPWKS